MFGQFERSAQSICSHVNAWVAPFSSAFLDSVFRLDQVMSSERGGGGVGGLVHVWVGGWG
jgi:hypothetical protein